MTCKSKALVAIALIALPVGGVVFHLAKPREFFVSATAPRPYDFMSSGHGPLYSDLFTKPLKEAGEISKLPPISKFQFEGSYEAKARFRDPAEQAMSYSFGKRFQAEEECSEIVLPTGQSIKLVAIARNRLEDIQPEGENLVPVTWFDPVTSQEISNHAESGLAKTPYVWRHYDTLVLAFALPKEGSCPIDILLTIGCGKPEEVAVDIRRNSAKQPALFEETGTRITVHHFTDGWMESGGEHSTYNRFKWNPPLPGNAYPALAIVSSWPRYRLEFMQAKAFSKKEGKEKWAWLWQNRGVGAAPISKPIAEAETIQMRLFPEIAHCHFKIPGFPGDQKVENLFDLKFDSITFENHGHIGRFFKNHLAVDVSAHYREFSKIRFPLDFQNATASEIARRIEKATNIRLKVNPVTFRLEKEPPSEIEKLWMKIRAKLN